MEEREKQKQNQKGLGKFVALRVLGASAGIWIPIAIGLVAVFLSTLLIVGFSEAPGQPPIENGTAPSPTLIPSIVPTGTPTLSPTPVLTPPLAP